MTLRERIVQNVIVKVAWTLVLVEAKGGFVAGIIRPWMPWS